MPNKIDISYVEGETQSIRNGNETAAMSQSDTMVIVDPEIKGSEESVKYKGSEVVHPMTYIETFLHLLKGNIGSGLLAMGDAFKNGGLIFSPIMTVILGIVSVHSQHLLLNCADDMHRKLKMTKAPDFAETVGLCFARGPTRFRYLSRPIQTLVNLFLCVTQLGFCCVYFVFIATNVQMIFDQFDWNLELSIHILIVLPIVLVSCMIRSLKFLTPLSTVAMILMCLGIIVVIYEAAQDLPPVNTRDYIAYWQHLPLYFGTVIYAFEGIGLVLPLKNEMKKPEQFQKPLGVLNVGMTFVGCIIIIVGFLGYLKYGDGVQGSLTLNMKAGHILSNIVQATIAVAMLLTYPLQFYVPIDITWPVLRKKLTPRSPVFAELMYRTLLVLLTFALAETIPKLGLFISLVGAISSTALALVFPPLIELVSKSQNRGGIPTWIIIKDCFIIILGIFIFITGTYESIASIIRAFQK